MDAVRSSSGILIMWSAASFSVSSITNSAHFLTVLFTLSDGFSFWLIGVYGPTTDSENWLIVGDFNLVRWPQENSNYYRPTREMSAFNSFIEQRNLIDSPLSNGSYTWTDFRNPPTHTKIDRFLYTETMINKFSDAFVNRLDFSLLLTLGKYVDRPK